MPKTSLYRLEVAPLIILPLTRSPFFSYASNTPVTKGSLVAISFGRQSIEGVVFDCQELPGSQPSWMKQVSRVMQPGFLTEEQCRLAQIISDEYFTPLGKTLRHFLPAVVQARQKSLQEGGVAKKKILLHATKEEQALLQTLTDSKKNRPVYLDTSLAADPKRELLLIVKESIKKKKQVLLLVPEITLIPGLEARFKECFAHENVTALHSKLSAGAFFSAWERIRSGKGGVVISTRQGLFAPWKNLDSIIVSEEQDESYKQWDMSPRYHGKRVAGILASLSHARLILTSGTPSVESLFLIEENQLLALRPLAKHPALGQALTIVNLKLERYRRNFSPLSQELLQALQTTLDRSEQALLYINRQGMNAFSVCEQCKNVFRCQACSHPLTSTREGHFRCSACGYQTSLFPSCPTCGHLAFRHIGFGTEKVEKEVHRNLPKARIARLDSSTIRTIKTIDETSLMGRSGLIDILVGTQMILKDPPLPTLALVAMIDADSLLLFPDFQADERLFQDLSRAVRQIHRSNAASKREGMVFVQTFRPESAFFQKALTLGSDAFLHKTLTERQELFYPPFSRLIAVTCQGKTEKDVTRQGTKLYDALRAVLPKNTKVQPPHPARYLKKGNRFESTLLLRFPAHETLPEEWRKLLIAGSKECVVDVDPFSLR